MRFSKTLFLFSLFLTTTLVAAEHEILVRFKSTPPTGFQTHSLSVKNSRPLLRGRPGRVRALSFNSEYNRYREALERTMIITVDGDANTVLDQFRRDPSVELAE